MNQEVDAVWIRCGLENTPEVCAFLNEHHGMPHVIFRSADELKAPGGFPGGKTTRGHRILVVDRTVGSLLDMPMGNWLMARCQVPLKNLCSTKATVWTQYNICRKQGKFQACKPFVQAYTINLQNYERELRKRYAACSCTAMVIVSRVLDPIACDAFGYTPRMIEMFGTLRNVKQLLITESGINDVQPLLTLDHKGHTIISWSVTCEEVMAKFQKNSVPLGCRVDAAKAVQDAGYEVRFRMDPFLDFPGWQDAYGRTIDAIYAKGIRPARFTLGSFRVPGNLRSVRKACFPQYDLLEPVLAYQHGRKCCYPRYIRLRFYRHAIAKIREHDKEVIIALCQESSEVHNTLDDRVDRVRCNCQE